MCEKQIKLTLEKARQLFGKNSEMDELLLSNFSKEELESPILPKSWGELEVRSGYKINYLATSGKFIEKLPELSRSMYQNKFTYATEKQAKSALAMAQLSQLIKAYNGDWEPDWTNKESTKIVICNKNNNITTDVLYSPVQFLAFKTRELRNEFLKNFEYLIKQYFMID